MNNLHNVYALFMTPSVLSQGCRPSSSVRDPPTGRVDASRCGQPRLRAATGRRQPLLGVGEPEHHQVGSGRKVEVEPACSTFPGEWFRHSRKATLAASRSSREPAPMYAIGGMMPPTFVHTVVTCTTSTSRGPLRGRAHTLRPDGHACTPRRATRTRRAGESDRWLCQPALGPVLLRGHFRVLRPDRATTTPRRAGTGTMPSPADLRSGFRASTPHRCAARPRTEVAGISSYVDRCIAIRKICLTAT